MAVSIVPTVGNLSRSHAFNGVVFLGYLKHKSLAPRGRSGPLYVVQAALESQTGKGRASGPFSSLAQLVVATRNQQVVTPDRRNAQEDVIGDQDELTAEPSRDNSGSFSSASSKNQHAGIPRVEETPDPLLMSKKDTVASRVSNKSGRKSTKVKTADAEVTATVGSRKADASNGAPQPKDEINAKIASKKKMIKQQDISDRNSDSALLARQSSRRRWLRSSGSHEAGSSNMELQGGGSGTNAPSHIHASDRAAANDVRAAGEDMEGSDSGEGELPAPSVRTLIDYKPKGRELPPITGEMILEAMQRAKANSPEGSRKSVHGRNREREVKRRASPELEMDNLKEIRVQRYWVERIASLKQRMEDVRTKLWHSN